MPEAESCDVLVIGGGIYGAWIAYDAALRGLRTTLIERDDWASGTSSASSKLIHGGLRYLEYGEFALVAKALRERARLRRLAPHAVRAQSFIIPHTTDFRMPRLAMFAGLWLYDHLGGAHPEIPAHTCLSRAQLFQRAPYLDAPDCVGGWTYGDGAEDDARFVLELIDGAAAAGAHVYAQCPALRLIRDSGRVTGALVRNIITQIDVAISAKIVVNAAGAWAGAVNGSDKVWPARHTKGIHLTLPPLPTDDAFLLQTPDRRVFFLIPFYGTTLVGTTDTNHQGGHADISITSDDIDYLLHAVNHRCPGLGWTRADVRTGFAGIRTLRGQPGDPSSVSREWELREDEPGVLMPLGGKYTSARVEAAHTVDRVQALLQQPIQPAPTAHRRSPWAPREEYVAWRATVIAEGCALGLDEACASTLPARYGRHIERLFTLLRENPALARRCHPLAPFCRAEYIHAARFERVHHLTDVLRRRIPLMIVAPRTRSVCDEAANYVGNVLHWSQAHRIREADAAFAAWWDPRTSTTRRLHQRTK